LKMYNTLFITTFCLVTAFFLSAGENSHAGNSVELRKVPPPEIIALDGKAKLLYGEFIKRQLQKRFPSLQDVVVSDKRYMFITANWFNELRAATEDFIDKQVPELASQPELPAAYGATYTMLMSSIANIAVAKRYKVKASVLIGVVTAKNNKPWGKIKADGKVRAYLIALTEDGALIYDFSTRQLVKGKEFPNKEYINKMLF